jgi:hypothetical protein
MPNVSQMSQEKAEKGPNFSKGLSPLGFTSSQILFSAAKLIGQFFFWPDYVGKSSQH